MELARRAVVTMNGLLASTAAVATMPGALAWPAVAEAVVRSHPSAAVDGLLCFGPLLVPALLLASGVALRSAWDRDPNALRLNAGALSAWAVAGVGGVAVFGAL
jgi:hypothetical protein